MAIRKFDPIGNPEDAKACDPNFNRLIPRDADAGDQEEPEEQTLYDPALALVPGRPAPPARAQIEEALRGAGGTMICTPDGIKIYRGSSDWNVWIDDDWRGLSELTPEQTAAVARGLARR